MKGYGQFCPVAKAAEIVGERWSILVIRELAAGSDSFNDLGPELQEEIIRRTEHEPL